MKKINVVLYHPEIPQNTGNIMRSCVGFDAKLHLIKPLGFKLDDKHMQRCAVDYFDKLDYELYEDYEDFLSKNKGTFFFLTRYGHKNPSQIDFRSIKNNIYLVFGKESTGIPYEILKSNLDSCFRIPTTDKIRALNLSNCVAIMLYLSSSVINNPNLITHEPESLKGEFFIDKYEANK